LRARQAILAHKNYCRNLKNFDAEGFPIPISGPAARCIRHCRRLYEKQLQRGSAYPFLEQLGRGWLFDVTDHALHYQTLRFNLAEILRYLLAIEFMAERFKGRRSLRLLEIGPGWADPLVLLGQMTRLVPKVRIDVIDIDVSRIDLGRVPQAASVKLYEADLNHINGHELFQRQGVYDAVTFFEVIEHLRPQRARVLLGRLHEVLKVGGSLFLSTPNEQSRNDFGQASHRCYYGYSKMRTILEAGGFDVLSIRGCLSRLDVRRSFTGLLRDLLGSVSDPWNAASRYFVATKRA
jgi:SAM-dependent methyltransferase